MRKFLAVLPMIAMVVGVSACREEIEPNTGSTSEDGKGKVESIIFKVGGSNADTKAGKSLKGSVRNMIPFSNEPGEEALFLEESVIDLDDVYSRGGVDTKGVPTYTENFGSVYDTFGADVYDFTNGNLNTKFTAGGNTLSLVDSSSPLKYKYSFSEGKWVTTYPNSLLFYMYAPSNIAGAGVSNFKANLNTTDNKKDKGYITFEFTTPSTASTQQDILFTSKLLTRDDYVNEKNNSVLFYHALAGIRFKCGNTVEGSDGKPVKDEYVTVTKIAVTGIYNTGKCTVSPQFDADGYVCGDSNTSGKTPKSKDVVSWPTADLGTSGTPSYELDGTITTAAEGQFPDSFYGKDGNLGDVNFNNSTFSNTFFFIPQTTPTGALVTITYNIKKSNGTESHTKTVAFNNITWQPGVLYTYKLTVRELGVYITDDMGEVGSAHATKSGVAITNSLNTNEFIRVAVIGNWIDSHVSTTFAGTPGHVLVNHAWDAAGDGSTTIHDNDNPVSFNTTYWTKGTDGFWYYKYPVKGGVTIPVARTIFESYTVQQTAAKEGSHLEMTLAVQAIDADKLGTASWPTAWGAPSGWLDSSNVDDGSETFPGSTSSN